MRKQKRLVQISLVLLFMVMLGHVCSLPSHIDCDVDTPTLDVSDNVVDVYVERGQLVCRQPLPLGKFDIILRNKDMAAVKHVVYEEFPELVDMKLNLCDSSLINAAEYTVNGKNFLKLSYDKEKSEMFFIIAKWFMSGSQPIND